MYKCECGREFEKRQAFIGHCGHCKVHLGNEIYIKNHELDLIKIGLAHDKLSSDSLIRKKNALDKWIAEKNKCKKCGKVMTKLYGSGVFCSESCARSFVALNQSEEAKRIKINALISSNHSHKGIKLSQETRRKISESSRRVMSDPAVRKKISDKMKGRKLSESTKKKLSDKAKLSYAEGRNKGWTTRRNQESYAEKFWRSVLDNNGISYQQEYKVDKPGPGCYFLDFLLPGNVDLEIDGHQHYTESRKIGDQKRDKYLADNGFIVYRIKWVDPRNSLVVKEDIDRFLQWYKEYLNEND